MKKEVFVQLCAFCFSCVWDVCLYGPGPAEAAAPEVEAALLLIPVLITEAAAWSHKCGGYVIQLVVLGAVAGGGSTALIIKSRAAKARSKRAMAVYAQMGGNWDYREIQQQVEETYFQVQECWRRMDVSYGAGYLSQELQDEFSSKLQWMQVRNEGVVQKNVRLLSAVPVYVIDHPGEEKDELWYLIHGKMKGYYIDLNTRKVVREIPEMRPSLNTGGLSTGISGGFWRKSGRRMR